MESLMGGEEERCREPEVWAIEREKAFIMWFSVEETILCETKTNGLNQCSDI